MKAYGYGYGPSFSRVLGGIDPQAQAYYDRVIADGGIVTLGLPALSDYFKAVKAARGQSDINNCFLSQYWAGFGIKTAAGVGATAGGRACEKLYNLIGTTNDAIQTSAANQPLALVHTGDNYVWLPGVNGNFFSAPSAVINRFRDNVDYKMNVTLQSYTLVQDLIGRYSNTAANRGISLDITATSALRLIMRFAGDTIVSSNATLASVGVAANQNIWLRVTRDATSGEVLFYYSLNAATTDPMSVVWVQLGTTVTSTTGTTTGTSDTAIGIGTFTPENGGNTLRGVVNRCTMSSIINAAPVVDFNPANYNRATSQTTWTSTTGEVWTLNTPETNNALKAAIVDQTMIMGNGTSYGLRAANLNINQTAITSYSAFRKFVNIAGRQMINEVSAGLGSFEGKNFSINDDTNQEAFAIQANVGPNGSRYTSNSLSLKLATYINNISNANESSPYLINNISQPFVSQPIASNNTAAMNATAYNLLARNNAASLWANAILIGDSIVSGEDSAGVRTAMWDIYKSLMKVA